MKQPKRQVILSALLELLQSRNFDEITVKDIVKKSKVNRQTFYYHFKNKFDCLEILLNQKQTKQWFTTDLVMNRVSWQKMYAQIYRYAIANDKFCHNLFETSGEEIFKQFIYKRIDQILELKIDYYNSDLKMNSEAVIMQNLVVYGLGELFFRWYQSMHREDIDDYLRSLIMFSDQKIEMLIM